MKQAFDVLFLCVFCVSSHTIHNLTEMGENRIPATRQQEPNVCTQLASIHTGLIKWRWFNMDNVKIQVAQHNQSLTHPTIPQGNMTCSTTNCGWLLELWKTEWHQAINWLVINLMNYIFYADSRLHSSGNTKDHNFKKVHGLLIKSDVSQHLKRKADKWAFIKCIKMLNCVIF